MSNDRGILISALEAAVQAWQEWKRARPILLHTPDENILAPLGDSIQQCEVFKAVQGRSLFSGDAGVVLSASRLALPLLWRTDPADTDTPAIEYAADWLMRVLTTRYADGMFIAAIWGLNVERETRIGENFILLPFAMLRDSPMKRRVLERAKTAWNNAVWTSHSYFDKPAVALVKRVIKFPYIGSPKDSFDKLIEAEEGVRELSFFLQAAVAGQPLAVGSWFEYEDQDLDLNSFENHLSWCLPEVVPVISSHVSVDPEALEQDIAAFCSLPSDWRAKLLRSMERYSLSKCRRQIVDQALDLAIAFEIAVSGGKGDNAPQNWKVGVRSTQAIGGTLQKRQQNRKALTAFYNLRNKGTHGGSLDHSEREKQEKTLGDAVSIYRDLLASFLALRAAPDWEALELEPRTRN